MKHLQNFANTLEHIDCTEAISTSPAIDAGDSAVFAARFPCASAASEVMGMAAMLRQVGAELDALADNAPNYDPASLRRRAHGLVRALVVELGGKVSL